MNTKFQEFAKVSGLDVYGLGTDREKWEKALNDYSMYIIDSCLLVIDGYCETSPEICGLPLDILEHFGIEDE